MNAGRGSGDAKERKAAAASLQQQIDDLVAGRTLPAAHPSFRDFIEREMAEDLENAQRRPESKKKRASSGKSSGAKTRSAKDRGRVR